MHSTLPNLQMPMPIRSGPWAWGYGRHSHQDQINTGEGISNQGIRTREYWAGILRPKGVEQFFFIPDESAISARTNPFMLRVAGKTLMTQLQPGDHFVVDKVDRLWRSVADYVDVRREFEARKITLHICNLLGASIQLGTPGGDFLMNMFVAGAQMESDQCSDRTRQRKRAMRVQGRYQGSRHRIPLGCRVEGDIERKDGKTIKNTLKLRWDPDKRRFMGELVRLADEERMNCNDIRGLLRTHFREYMGEQFFKTVIVEHDWTAFSIAKHYWREKQYRALPPFDPNQIRFAIFDSGGGAKFRDIGRSEPSTANPLPFLNGQRIPTADELRAA